MTQIWRSRYWGLSLVSALAIGEVIASPFSNDAIAQLNLTPDTVRNRNLGTKVVPLNSQTDLIRGGTPSQNGSNLFHSFSEFNVRETRGAYFDNPADEVKNILTRVTGKDPSDILGTLGVLGNANLFLINPKGIIFGPRARLDLNGSFVASTANSLVFDKGIQFSATAPETAPMLMINVPIGLQFGGTAEGIQVKQSSLKIQSGQTLALVGGDITIKDTRLVTSGGRLELGSVTKNSLVNLTSIDKGWALGYKGVQNFQDILLREATISADSLDASSGGDIQIRSAQLKMTQSSRIFADSRDAGAGGEVLVQTTEAVTLSDNSEIATGALGSGTAGNLKIETGRLIVQDGSELSASTYGVGQGGTLEVIASDSVELIGTTADEDPTGLFAQTEGTGDAGNLLINTGKLTIRDGAAASASTSGAGNAGDLTVIASDSVELIGTTADGKYPSNKYPSKLSTQVNPKADGAGGNLTIQTGQLTVKNGAQVSAETFGKGQGGILSVTASDSVEVIGRSADGQQLPSGLFVSSEGVGDAGGLTIKTKQLTVEDKAEISASTVSSQGGNIKLEGLNSLQVSNGGQISASTETGQAGSLSVNINENAADSMQLSGQDSGLFAQAIESGGSAGSLTINTEQLTVKDVAKISATTTSGIGGDIKLEGLNSLEVSNGGQISTSSETGRAGSLSVNVNENAAESVELSGKGSVLSAQAASGSAGSLTINTKQLTVQDGAKVSASTRDGQAGSLSVNINENAAKSVELSGKGSVLSVEATNGGTAGSMTIDTEQLTVRDGAAVKVSSPEGQAGNLTITTNTVHLDKGSLTARTGEAKPDEPGAIINLQDLDLLLLENGSLISAEATGDANGGNITIKNTATGFIVATPREDSNIIANASKGRGGNIEIETQGIFGIKERKERKGTNDIDASSESGVQGNVTINTPDVDPSQQIANLPIEPVNTEIAQDCQGGGGKESSRFISSGSGGLPTNPYEPLDSRDILADVQLPTQWTEKSVEEARVSTSPKKTPAQIVEAQGWSINETGEVVLVAEVPRGSSQRGCHLR